MARPGVFVPSSYYDLKHVRDGLRICIAAVAFYVSTMCAFGEETYIQTGIQLAKCLGDNMRVIASPGAPIVPPELLDGFLLQECGDLEKKQEHDFLAYLDTQLMRKLSDQERAVVILNIAAQMINHNTRGGSRRMLVDAYRKATRQK